jgi:hypothetical protein
LVIVADLGDGAAVSTDGTDQKLAEIGCVARFVSALNAATVVPSLRRTRS